jgi:hypothetical protein
MLLTVSAFDSNTPTGKRFGGGPGLRGYSTLPTVNFRSTSM